MIQPRLFLCNGVQLVDDDPRAHGRQVIKLSTFGADQNVNIHIEDVARIFQRHLSPRLVDLLEIASYVYTADCATRRGNAWQDDAVEAWSRDFQFIIPIRDVNFWQNPEVYNLLGRLLNFLSNDNYKFQFEKLEVDRSVQEYLEFNEQSDWPFYDVDRVLMFSGGLDSLAGAVETAANGENLVLVSHRSVGLLGKRQITLFKQLRKLCSTPMIHIPVLINKDQAFGREHTQRTRSFLYSALGTVVAESLRAKGVRFFENGIVSLNLPIADEVLRARASRTTHPYAISLLSQLHSLVTERDFVVDNPFVFYTKADVVSLIAEHGAGQLIAYTCSCAHTGIFKSKSQEHCGTCSQCIDRRIAIIAANQTENDPEFDYVTDVFTGDRTNGYEQNIAVGYARFATELCRMSEEEISHTFNLELGRAAREFPKRRESVQEFINLHKRHGQIVYTVLQQQLQENVGKLMNGELANKSMLALIFGQEHLSSSWQRLADQISAVLQAAIPIACQTHKPKNEPHLQQICDGILQGHDGDLVREFPFMRWSSSLTKPDWSSEELRLWVELKYVREKSHILEITEAIAADITKYGDNQRRAIYIVYDPNHLITNEQAFSAPIVARSTMYVAFVR